MRSRLLSITLITIVICGLFANNLLTETASAKGDNSLFWDAPVKVSQPAKAKPGRTRPKPRPKPDSSGREESPLLTLKYNMLLRGPGGTPEKVDPARDWKVGDQLRLAVTPNQSGFLYIVHQSVDDKGKIIDQPHIIFPSPGINAGNNEVVKDKEYVVPKYCPEFENPDDCWWEITPPGGTDSFTVIFSRDKITDLKNKLTESDAKEGGDAVKAETIATIKKASNTKSIARADKIRVNSRSTTESDGTYVQNTSKEDNEELFEVIDLKHPSKGGDDPVAMTRALFVKKRSAAMHVSFIKESDRSSVDPSKDVFKEGDAILVRSESNFNGYVYFVNITPTGRKYLIFPCGKEEKFNLEPGATTVTRVEFDDEKGTEVLQVIMTRERIDFLEKAMKGQCCDSPNCELSASASSAAAELATKASKQQKGGISVNNLVAVVPETSSGGIRARGIKLAQGPKGSAYVAIESPADPNDNKLEAGRYAVFEIRLNHN